MPSPCPTQDLRAHGLLSRVENESQLSMILGHEMTHVTNRHALMFNRDAQNKQIWFTALAIAASLGVAVAAGGQQGKGNYVSAEVLRTTSNIFLGLGLQLAFIASVNGFGRDLEREADREGMDRMVKAGYDPREAPRVFALLKNDHGDGASSRISSSATTRDSTSASPTPRSC